MKGNNLSLYAVSASYIHANDLLSLSTFTKAIFCYWTKRSTWYHLVVFFLVLQVVELKSNKPRTWTGVEYSTSNCFPRPFYICTSWKKSYLDYCKYYLMISHHISANRAWWKSCINLIYILSHVIFKTHLITEQADASQEKSSHCLCILVFYDVNKGINSQIFS